MADLVGTYLGRYYVLRQIGQGGMATVYEAYQPGLDRRVAIKALPPYLVQEKDFSQRFSREATAIGRLEHPNILPVHDCGEEGGVAYLVMKYVPGGTLKDVIGQPHPMSYVVKTIRQIAAALDYAHQRGIVHRDVKPGNILLAENDWVLLSDFGIAKIVGGAATLTMRGVGIGTPAYMAPEQSTGEADQRSDIYSLGVVLYEMVTGTLPFNADTPMAIILKHINEPLPRPSSVNPRVPWAVERVILKALAKRPEDRYQSAGELAGALDEAAGPYLEEVFPAGSALADDAGAAIPPTDADAALHVTPRPALSRTALLAIGGITGAVVLLAVVLGFILTRGWHIGRPAGNGVANMGEPTAVAALVTSPLVVPPSAGGGRTYFVAPNGSDGNAGTPEQPWRSLQRAIDAAQPGDTVQLRGGVYHEHVRLVRSGRPGQPITFAAYPGETVWLDGEGVQWKYGFEFGDPGASHVNVIGLNMRNWRSMDGDGACIVSWRESDYVTIRDLEVHHCGSVGITFAANSDYVTVENVLVHDNDEIGLDCGTGPCNHWVLRRVHSLNNGSMTDDTAADGLAVEAGDDIVVEDCESIGNAGDGFDFKSSNTILRNVIALNNRRNGIKLWGKNSRLENSISAGNGNEGLVLEGGGDYVVVNSLIANTTQYGYTVALGSDKPVATPVTLINNIFSTTTPGNGGTLLWADRNVDLRADYNLYFAPNRTDDVICWDPGRRCFPAAEISSGVWSKVTGQDAHSRYGDPRFQNEAGGDFRPTPASPTVDAGTCQGVPPTTFDHQPRPQGATCDVGPFER